MLLADGVEEGNVCTLGKVVAYMFKVTQPVVRALCDYEPFGWWCSSFLGLAVLTIAKRTEMGSLIRRIRKSSRRWTESCIESPLSV